MSAHGFIRCCQKHGGMATLGVAMATSLLLSVDARAEGMFTFKPYAAATATYDDNLFRLANPTQSNTSAMSDWIRSTQVGINVDVHASLQNARLELGVNESKFDHNKYLDNTGRTSKLAWDWQLGHNLSGEASYGENTMMSGFSEIHNALLNMRKNKDQLFKANWDVNSSWRIYALEESLTLSNSQVSYRASDREDTIEEGGIRFTSMAGNALVLSVRDTQSKFPNRDMISSIFFGNANDQREIGADLTWQATGKTHLHAKLTDVSRQYQDLPQRDFNGLSERLDVDWAATGKSALSGSVWREIAAVDDLGSTYVQSTGVSLAPTWLPTAKIAVSGKLAYEQRVYLGDPGTILAGQTRREDQVLSSALSAVYTPYRRVQVQLGYLGERRISNVTGNAYRDNSVNASIRYDY